MLKALKIKRSWNGLNIIGKYQLEHKLGIGRMSPSFLILVVDQMSSASLGCNGNKEVLTPNLDQLAKSGTTFRRAYCNNPICQPSRATMLTGLTPRQHGLCSNGNLLDEGVPTITEALVKAGYRTHSVGKLHLQPFINIDRSSQGDDCIESWESEYAWRCGCISNLPRMYYGFQTTDFIEGHGYYSAGDYTKWLNCVHPNPASLYVDSDTQGRFKHDTMKYIPPELHYNNWIADCSIAFLDNCSNDTPFFLWCSFPDPHHPFIANEKYRALYDAQSLTLNSTWQVIDDPCSYLAQFRASRKVLDEAYLREITAETYGMITHIDEQIGRVLNHLEQIGRAQDTVIVFMSDHGEYLGSHGLHQKELWPYEELNRIPFIWKVPNNTSGSTDSVVSMLDFVPTILDYAGLDVGVLDKRVFRNKECRFLHGRSLRLWLDDGMTLAERPALIEFDKGQDSGPRTIVESRWKLTVFPPTGQGLLYDLKADPHEMYNCWDEPSYANEKARLICRLLDELVMSDRFDAQKIANA